MRFAIAHGGRRARHWRVRSGAHRPEVFIEAESIERAAHLSLHESGEWHLKVKRQVVYRWPRPAELVPGYTRALALIELPSLATHAEPEVEGTVLVPLADPQLPMMLDLFLERPGANLMTWPGKSGMGTELVGRLPLAGGAGTCCVVARRGDASSGSFTVSGSEEEIAAARSAMGDNVGKVMSFFGAVEDGTPAFFSGRIIEPPGTD